MLDHFVVFFCFFFNKKKQQQKQKKKNIETEQVTRLHKIPSSLNLTTKTVSTKVKANHAKELVGNAYIIVNGYNLKILNLAQKSRFLIIFTKSLNPQVFFFVLFIKQKHNT